MGHKARRIEDLEVKVAYLEARLADLDEVLREFADRVVSLQREVSLLRQAADADQLAGDGVEEPPHY